MPGTRPPASQILEALEDDMPSSQSVQSEQNPYFPQRSPFKDWYEEYNPRLPRTLKVDIPLSYDHEGFNSIKCLRYGLMILGGTLPISSLTSQQIQQKWTVSRHRMQRNGSDIRYS
jgi:hypothetical protein